MADPKKDIEKAEEQIRKAREAITDEEALKLLQDQQDILDQMPEKAKAVADAVRSITKAQRELADSSKTLEAGTERLIKTLTGVTKNADGLVAGLARMTAETKEGETHTQAFGRALGKMADTMGKTMTKTNIGIAVFKKFAEGTVLLTKGVDTATSAFAKAAGTGAKYNSVIEAAEYRNRHLGVSAAEAQAATAALHGGFSEFLMLSTDAQTTLATTVASFETFGVAASTTTKFLEGVTRVTGRTHQEALRLQKSIMATAKAFGDDLNKVMEETAAIMPKLAIHGQNLESVLDNLYSASKRTGMAMDDIVGMATRFDTFDAAADAAGNLNAVLGQMGGAPLIDTMQILEETDPAKRMQLFADAIEQSVGNYEDLGYFQQIAIADAMGLNVEEARRLLLQEEQTSAMDVALAKRGLGETDILEMQKQGRDLATEINILIKSFAVSLQGPIGYLKDFVGLLSTGLTKVRELGAKLDSWGGFGKNLKGIALLGLAVGAGGTLLTAIARLALKGTRLFPMWTKPGSRLRPMWTKSDDIPGLGGGLPRSQQFGVRGRGMGKIKGPLIGLSAAISGLTIASGRAQEAAERGHTREAASRKKGIGWGALAGLAVGLGALALAPGTGGMSLAAAATWGGVGLGVGGLAGGEAAPTLAGTRGMAEGGIVTRPTPTVVGEGGQNEAVVPLPNGRSIPVSFGDGDGGFKTLSAKLDKVIAAIENNVPVLVKGDLEAAGFMQGSRVAVS